MNFTRQNVAATRGTTHDKGLREYMLGVFGYMSLALFITGIVAFLASSPITPIGPAISNLLYAVNPDGTYGISGLGYVVAFAPIIFVLTLSFGINAMSVTTARIVLLAYATVMGLSLSFIFITYTGESIARTFFIAASVFASMSIYGYTTKRDLTHFGSFLIMGLIGVLIASVVNMFLHSSAMAFIISIIGVLVFTGLTAYDVQNISRIYWALPAGEQREKAAVMGTLRLYLDFINLLLFMLRFFGHRR